MSDPARCDLAIVGAGVGGCALAAQLRRLGWGGTIQLLEIGRGPGGRCATRRSRHDAELAINHGAPLFNISQGEAAPALLAPLQQSGWIVPFTGVIRWLDGDGRVAEGFADGDGPGNDAGFLHGSLWQGAGAMEQLCRGLLALAGSERLHTRYGVLVRQLEPVLDPMGKSDGWILRDGEGTPLLRCDRLVLSGSLLAHPRCRSVFGWPDVPLQQAAAALTDPQLDRVAQQLASIGSTGSSNLLLTLSAADAAAWVALPWRLLQCTAAAEQRWGLRRITIQPLAGGRCAVVAESSPAFAAAHRQVYGSRSSAAQLLGAAPDAAAEAATLDALQAALKAAVGVPIAAGSDRQLMRWGAAFPQPGAVGLAPDLQLCRASRIGFCGDAIGTRAGFGRVEGALRSAETLAAGLVQG